MIQIKLYHAHYDGKHLEHVKQQMKTLGAPTIRCIWSDIHGIWMAVEGCHRLRAAKELGITPRIKDITRQKTVTMQLDGEPTRLRVADLLDKMEDDVFNVKILTFDEEGT